MEFSLLLSELYAMEGDPAIICMGKEAAQPVIGGLRRDWLHLRVTGPAAEVPSSGVMAQAAILRYRNFHQPILELFTIFVIVSNISAAAS